MVWIYFSFIFLLWYFIKFINLRKARKYMLKFSDNTILKFNSKNKIINYFYFFIQHVFIKQLFVLVYLLNYFLKIILMRNYIKKQLLVKDNLKNIFNFTYDLNQEVNLSNNKYNKLKSKFLLLKKKKNIFLNNKSEKKNKKNKKKKKNKNNKNNNISHEFDMNDKKIFINKPPIVNITNSEKKKIFFAEYKGDEIYVQLK